MEKYITKYRKMQKRGEKERGGKRLGEKERSDEERVECVDEKL